MLSPFKQAWLPAMAAAAVVAAVVYAARVTPTSSVFPSDLAAPFAANVEKTVAVVDDHFAESWQAQGLSPAAPADELTVLRRLWLALIGNIPSLEEIREFEADAAPGRLDRWTLRAIADPRFADYFAERLAVAFIGDRANDMPGFRRQRFSAWLSGELRTGAPFDELVRRMISAEGPLTVFGETGFAMAEISHAEDYHNRLASRVARAFLGQRIDCAECHDHPFANWKQSDFDGLAAFFAPARRESMAIFDSAARQLVVKDRKTDESRTVLPRAPFDGESLPADGDDRQRLAAWTTHSNNRRFRRAIANRVWGLMFGRPYLAPVDDLPDPQPPGQDDPARLLDLLGDDLAANGWDLRRLVYAIAGTRVFRLDSAVADEPDAERSREAARQWAAFPLVLLRPEQVGRSLWQLRSLRPLRIDETIYDAARIEHWLREFAEQYGDLGEMELDERTGSIQQTLVRMSGRFVRESIAPGPLRATSRLAALADDPAACVESCFLTCLTRRPTAEESEHFSKELLEHAGRRGAVVDFFWAAINSPEFVWNH